MSGLLLALLLACGPEPAAPEAPASPVSPSPDPHQQAVERLLDFPPEASSFEEPDLRSLELVRHEDRGQVMELLPLEPGLRVADVGCGLGHFTFHLARAVGPTGSVQAVDLEPRYLAIVQQRLADPDFAHPGNIALVQGEPDRLPLEAGSVDLAFLSHLDFHLVRPLAPERHVAFLRSVGEALAPGGRLAVLQWLGARDGATVEDLIANYQDLGFAVEAQHDLLEHGSVLVVMRGPR